jgi:hypothetical protein
MNVSFSRTDEYRAIILSIVIFVAITAVFVVWQIGDYLSLIQEEERSDVAGLENLLIMFMGYYLASVMAGLANSYFSSSTNLSRIVPMSIIFLTMLVATTISSSGLSFIFLLTLAFILGMPACGLFYVGTLVSTRLFQYFPEESKEDTTSP